MKSRNSLCESNPFTTSAQVREILHDKGFSFLFNWADYERYKRRTRKAFNRAYSIATLFLEQAEQNSDYSQYTF